MSKERLEQMSFETTKKSPEVDFNLIQTATRMYEDIPVDFRVYKAFNRKGKYRLDDWITYQMPKFPEIYFGSHVPGEKLFPTKKSAWKDFDIGFGKKLYNLLPSIATIVTEEQSRIIQALLEKTGYAAIARKMLQQAVDENIQR